MPRYVLLLCLWCYTICTNAQCVFHSWVNYKGRIEMRQLTGKPYPMAVYAAEDPLSTEPITHRDSINKVTCYMKFDPDDTIRKPEKQANMLMLYSDYAGFSPIINNYCYAAYPGWVWSFNSSPENIIRQQPQKGKYLYTHDEMYFSDNGHSMPDLHGGGRTWQLDSQYRIRQMIEGNYIDTTGARIYGPTQIRDTLSCYSYSYTPSGHIAKCTAYAPGDTLHRSATYFFYNKDHTLKYLVAVRKDTGLIDEAFCHNNLEAMKRQGRYVQQYQPDDYEHRNTAFVTVLVAYNYDSKGRFTSSLAYNQWNYIYLTADSVRYNKRGLPVTIDRFHYGTTEGAHMAIYYNRRGRIKETESHFSFTDYRGFPADRNSVSHNRYYYDKKGRIIRKDFTYQADPRIMRYTYTYPDVNKKKTQVR